MYLKKELYELIRTDESIFDFIQESSIDGLWYWDLENPENEWMNAKFWTVLGYNPDEMPHKSTAWQNIINQEDLKIALDKVTKHCENPNHPYDQIVRYTHKNGSIVWIRCRGLAIRDKDGKPIRMLGAHQDVSDIKRREQELIKANEKIRESQEKYRSFYNNAPLSYQSLDENGCFIDINPMWSKTLGYERDEVIGKWYGDFLHPDYVEHFRINFPAFKKRGYVSDVQFKLRRKDNTYIYVSFEGCVGYTPEGKFRQTYCVFKDISDTKKAEQALIESELKFRALFEKGPIGVAYHKMVYDASGNPIDYFFLDANEAYQELTGVDPRGKLVTAAFPGIENDPFDWIGVFGKVALTGETIRFEGHLEANQRWYDCVGYQNKPDHFVAAFSETTKRKKVEIQLQQTNENLIQKNIEIEYNNERLESLLKISQYSSNSIQELLDFALSEAIKLTRSEIGYIYFYDESTKQFILNSWSKEVMKECRVMNPQTVYELDKTGCWGEAVRQRKPIIINDYQEENSIKKGMPDGHVQLKKFLTIPVFIDNKIVAVCGVANKATDYDNSDIRQLTLLMDSVWKISERMTLIKDLTAAKEKAEESEEKLIEAQELSHVGSWEYFSDSDTINWSKELFNIFERSTDLAAPKYSEQASFYTEESFAKLDKAVQDCLRHEIPYEIELDIKTSSGAVKQIISKGNVIKDINKKVIGCYGTAQDITDRKIIERELVKAKEKAEESDRLKSAFLANISHEIRTPMNGIMGFTELLLEPDLGNEEQEAYIKIVHQSGQRMLNTVNNLVEISKIEAGIIIVDLIDIDVHQRLDELIRFFNPQATKKGLKLILKNELSKTDAVISTDQNKLDSILTNLIKNAIKYTFTGEIRVGCLAHEYTLEFYVKDTGIGIPAERQQAVFDRFVQADIEDVRALEGSGLGLSIAKAYVEGLGGKIWLESEEGVGTTFYFTLPKEGATLEKKELPFEPVGEKHERTDNRLKILIVEDDEASYLHLSLILNNNTSEILYEYTGIKAVEMVQSNPDIDVILMDIKIPGMDGLEATRKIREFNKDVVIIAQTAHALSGDREKTLAAGCDEYIAKPVKKQDLLALIRKHTVHKNTNLYSG